MAAPTLVQSKYWNGGSGANLTLDDAPTVGNRLILKAAIRNPPDSPRIEVSDAEADNFSLVETATNGRSASVFTRVVQPGDDAVIVVAITDTDWIAEEWTPCTIGSPVATLDAQSAATTITCGGSVTPTAGIPTTLTGFAVIGGGDTDFDSVSADPMTPTSGVTEISDVWDGFSPLPWAGYRSIQDPDGTTAYVVSADTNTTSKGWCGITVALEGAGAVTPPADGPPVFEVHDPTDTLIATFTELVDWKIREELEGTGAGSFTIRRDHTDATEAILKTGNVVKVTIPRIDPDPIFAFIIGPKTAHVISKDEEGGETITIIGDGILSYLRREIVWHESWELGFKTDPPPGGVIKTAATGMKPGQLLNRLVAEAQRAERPLGAIPLVTRDFDYDVDSDGLTWASATQTTELLGYVGDNLLDDVVGRLLGTGVITIRMGPDFDLHAYNTYGRDLTSLTFAADKVRFVRGVNIADALKRETEADIPPNGALIVGDDDTYVVGEIVTGYPDRTIFIKTQGTDTAALEANAEGDLTRLLSRHESLPFKLAIGAPGTEDELTGHYLPGPPDSANGHFWVGDDVTVHTGTGNFDLNNHEATVQAVTLSGDKADNLEAIVELGAVIKIGPRSSPRASGRGVSDSGGAGGSLPTGTPPPTGDAVLLSGHAADTADAHDASAISVLDTAAHFTGTNVETVLDEIADSHDAHVADASDAHDAAAISVADAGANFTADNVEDVLAELAAGGGSSLTVEDEGTPLATSATTLDFVGAGVTATGAGAEKTITIPGSSLTVEEVDGAPSVSGVTTIVVSNGTLTDDTGGQVTITTGGGAGGGNVSGQSGDSIEILGLSGSADRTPASPAADDDEFDTTDASDPMTGWTTLGTPTSHDMNTTILSHYYLRKSAATLGLHGIYKACPAFPFTVTTKIADYAVVGGNARASLFVAEAAPGKILSLGFSGNTQHPGLVIADIWTNRTTYGSTPVAGVEEPGTRYLRMVVTSSTAVQCYFSLDGRVWWTFGGSINPSMTIGAVGLMVDPHTSGQDAQLACDWIRFT